MTQEQIEQAAKEYENNLIYHEYNLDYTYIICAFITGAESRQAEINNLTSNIEHYKQDIADGLKREEIARKVIEDKRGEVKELKEALRGLYDMCAEGRTDEGTLYNTQQILKKYEK